MTTKPTTFLITQAALSLIEQSVGVQPAEQGGPLGGRRSDGVVTHFLHDVTARRTGMTYSPDHDSLNRLFDEWWNPKGINLLGFVHSHPAACGEPSMGDLAYAKEILAALPKLPYLYLPIVQSAADTGSFELRPFAVVRVRCGVRVQPLELKVVEEPDRVAAVSSHDSADQTFARVSGAYNLDRLAHCRVVTVGIGGAAGFVEDLGRAGVGEQVLIDPDVVTETNLATQQVYRRDLGRRKVDCVAERLRDINSRARILVHPQALDAIDDTKFLRLAKAPIEGAPAPKISLICGLTDSFAAQARINRLALKFSVPSLCAQVYREGRGGEITFTYPGITPACHRCVLSARYAAYLSEGFQNDVTSNGTPIFATTRLNALKGFLVMAILHNGTDHPRFGGLLARIGNRNLIQLRLDPDLSSTLGLGVFDRVLQGADQNRLLFDEVVWLPQAQDREELNGRPTCPDCGGTGNLAIPVEFADTRLSAPSDQGVVDAPVP